MGAGAAGGASRPRRVSARRGPWYAGRRGMTAPSLPPPPSDFHHRFIPGTGAAAGVTLLLLHGTGGDADSLLQLGGTLLPGAALLSPTGKVRERGAPRFFRRLAEGVFDQEDLALRTVELARFVRDAAAAYDLDAGRTVAVGYSNGANIAASILLREPTVLAGAILLRAMVPFEPTAAPALSGVPVLLCAGATDPIIPLAGAERLAQILRAADADVSLHVERAGHALTMGDVLVGTEWLRRNFLPGGATRA